MLVAMATGTGKTFMTVNEVYRLMKSGVAKRILFLVDRRALAAQAVRTFASFEPEPGHKFNQLYQVYSQRFHKEDFDEGEKFDPTVLPGAYLLEPKLGDAFVYVCTIQRMAINLFGRETVLGDSDEVPDEDAEELKNIPIHAFDLVIADECHRGIPRGRSRCPNDPFEGVESASLNCVGDGEARNNLAASRGNERRRVGGDRRQGMASEPRGPCDCQVISHDSFPPLRHLRHLRHLGRARLPYRAYRANLRDGRARRAGH